MLFNSYVFIFLFLPVALAGFFLLGRAGKPRAAGVWLTLASLFFYAWWNPRYLPIIVGSTIANYWIGVAINRARRGQLPCPPRLILGGGVALNLAALGYYKYAGFFTGTLDSWLGLHLPIAAIVLPLAISFFTFTQIAYLVDSYHGVTEAHDFLYYALFVTFFPHLIAGPIVSYRRLMPQFAQAAAYRFHWDNAAAGLSLFCFGLGKKVLLADNVSILARHLFDDPALAPHGSPGAALAWVGALAYTFQLYFDFSGYSDMAIGLARMFNIRFPLNFDSPYRARSIADFWHRWHITLSLFLRDHLYIPLGGNRKGELRSYLNLMATMLLGGLWHGAGWTFILWGGLHGLYLGANRAWDHAAKGTGMAWAHTRAMRGAGRVLTFLCVVAGWVFFRAHGLHEALTILGAMGEVRHPGLGELSALIHGSKTKDYLTAFLALGIAAAIAFLGPNLNRIFCLAEDPRKKAGAEIPSTPPLWSCNDRWACATALVFTLSVLHFSKVSEFLYFRF